MTEPTKKDILRAVKAASRELGEGVSVVLIISVDTEKGQYLNRASNVGADEANEIIIKWTQNLLHREEFGKPNQN